MPAPDPDGIEPGWDSPLSVMVYHWPCQSRKHRNARARRILQNLRRGGWCCLECGDPVPFMRRADAVYCREGCRKRAARARKAVKGAQRPSGA